MVMTNIEVPPTRPQVLSLLCIITFAWGLIRIVMFLMALLFPNPGLNNFLNHFLGINSTFYIIAWIALALLTLSGAGLMWKLKKAGFYIYSLAVCLEYVLPAISSGADMMTIQRLFFTSVFIFFYGLHLKFMN